MTPAGGSASIEDDFSGDSLADLMAAIALHEQDQRLADAASKELHVRWGGRIDQLCRRQTLMWKGRRVGWHALAQAVWEWIWKHADTFTAGGKSGDALDARFYRWIETCARCRLIDLLREQGRVTLAELPSAATLKVEEQEDTGPQRIRGIFISPVPGSPEADAERVMLAGFGDAAVDAVACLRQLSPRDQELLQSCAPYLIPGEREVDIPEAERQAMITELGTTSKGLKALRNRAFQKVEKCMKERAKKRGGEHAP